MKYAGYFLIVSDFIKWAKTQGIPVGPGRGSGAGSLVAWALTGPTPNMLADLADETVAIAVPGTASVQEAHQVVVHLLCESLDRTLGVASGERFESAGVRP